MHDDHDEIRRIHVSHGDQTAGIVHQAAIGIERDDLALGEGGREAQRKRNTEPHDWADWASAAEEASEPRLIAMRKILATRNIDTPPNIFRSTTESFFE